MSELHNGNEVCSTCKKPYIPLLNGEFCKCETDATHTDPQEQKAAEVLKWRQRTRVLRNVLTEIKGYSYPGLAKNEGSALNKIYSITTEALKEIQK